MRSVPRPTVRSALAGALLAAGLAVAGCGADVSIRADPTGTATNGTAATGTAATGRAAASSPAPTPTATGLPAGALTSPPAAGVGNAGELPAGFPLPPGTTVGPVALAGNEIAATLTIRDGKSGYAFWRALLPAAGYLVAKAEMVGGIGEITFSGNGCAAGSQLGISDQTVAFECKRA